MSQWDKLLIRILKLSNDLRFSELRKIIESFGYVMIQCGGGSSHYVFRKPGFSPITIPKHEPIKKCYVLLVKEVVERENNHENNQ